MLSFFMVSAIMIKINSKTQCVCVYGSFVINIMENIYVYKDNFLRKMLLKLIKWPKVNDMLVLMLPK